MNRRFLAIALTALFACGPRNDASLPQVAKPANLTLPAPIAIADGVRVEMSRPPTRVELKRLERQRGVSVVTTVTIRRSDVAAGTRALPLRITAVDPIAFRSFAPAPTRAADFVWTSLAAGEAVLTPEATKRLEFEAPGSITLRKRKFQIGAFADNGTPNLGDVMVNRRALSATGPTVLLVGARDPDAVPRITRHLRTEMRGVQRVERLVPQPAQAVAAAPADPADPVGRAEGDLIGAMTFRILKSGFIEPDPAWVAASIASGEVPVLGRVTCHRLVFPQLAAALAEIQQEGLASRIHRGDYGGCYVPRFIDRDPRRGLSMHAFGLALDLNVSENYLGTRGHMDPRVVAIFEKWGFGWGGRWSRPDPMHFELARVIQP